MKIKRLVVILNMIIQFLVIIKNMKGSSKKKNYILIKK